MTHLTIAEACLIIDVLNGAYTDDWEGEEAASLLCLEVFDAISLDGAAAKWLVDGPRLIATLAVLPPAEASDLVARARRFWDRQKDRESSLLDQIMALFAGCIAPEPAPRV